MIDRNLHSTPRIGQILVDIRRYAREPDAVLREVTLKVKDFLDDDKTIVEIVVTNTKGANT